MGLIFFGGLMKGVKESVFFSLVLLFFGQSILFSFHLYAQIEKENQISWEIHLKVVDERGKILSGFEIFYEKELVGKVDTFGEWEGFISRATNAPFFLTIVSSLDGKELFKRVEIQPDQKGSFVVDELVVFDRVASSLNLNSLDEDMLLASKKREALGFIYFSFAQKKEAQNKYFSFGEALKLETELKKEASRLGFFYDMEALLQVYLEPLEREMTQGGISSILSYGIHVRFPYDERRTFFEYKENAFSSPSWTEDLFLEIKKRASIPVLIKRVDEEWFLSEKNVVQEKFWNFPPSLELKTHLTPVRVSTKKRNLNDETLYNLIPAEGNFCKLPDKDFCYLYSKPLIP